MLKTCHTAGRRNTCLVAELCGGAEALAKTLIYWIFTKLAGLNVADGLRTWTVLTTLLGTLGFCITLLIWPFV